MGYHTTSCGEPPPAPKPLGPFAHFTNTIGGIHRWGEGFLSHFGTAPGRQKLRPRAAPGRPAVRKLSRFRIFLTGHFAISRPLADDLAHSKVKAISVVHAYHF